MGGEGESSLEVSEPETQFVPQEGDEEELWEVIEITAEKGRKYKVKWAGTDPKTQKPWPQSWVAKHDCTDDLVKTWKKVQALKKKGVQRKSGKTASTVSKKSRSSTVVRGSTTSSTNTAMNLHSHDTTPIAGPLTLNANGKRKHSPPESVQSANLSKLGAAVEPPPRKKRKLEVETVDEVDVSDGDATPVVKVGRVGIPKAVPDKGKRKANVMDVDEVEEESVSVREGRKAKTAGRRKDLLNDQNSVTLGQRKTPATKKAKTKSSVTASRRSSTTQRAVSPVSSEDGEPPKNPLSVQSKSLSLERQTHNTSPLQQRSPSMHYQSPPMEHRTPSPEFEMPLSPPGDSPRLSPMALAQLAAFDEFMVKGSGKTVPPHSRGESDINRMYDDYVDFSPQDEHEPSKPTGAPNGLSKDPISSPPASPPPPRERDTEPLPTDDEDLHPMSSSPPPLRPKQARASNGVISNGGSFRQGVVPETETQSSTNHTQSQPQQPVPVVPQIVEPPSVDPTTTTPARASLIRRMRPRTPGSATGSKLSLIDEANIYDPLNHDYDDGDGVPPVSSDDWPNLAINTANANGKSLRPVPVLSPSKFAPHLPHSSISNQAMEEAEVEDLMSSIEQFSSSENEGSEREPRPKRKQRRNKGRGKKPEPEPESEPELEVEPHVQAQDASITEEEDSIEVSVMERGQRMAEAARKERLAREKLLAGEALSQRVTLVDLLKANKKAGKWKGKSKGRKPPSSNNGTESSSSEAHRPLSVEPSARGAPELDAERPDELGDADADGEVEEDIAAVVDLRQEEEESTQDIMEDMRRGMDEVDVEAGWDLAGPTGTQATPGIRQESPAEHIVGNGSEEVIEDLLSQPNDSADDIIMETISPTASPRPRSQSSPRPRSVSAHPEPLRPANDESQSVLPPTASTRQSTPDVNPEAISQDEPEHLGAAMVLLNTKSEEIAKLDALLVAEQAKTEALTQEIETLRAAVTTADNGPRSKEAGIELELDLSEARSLLIQERSAWDAERSQLAASMEALARQKASVQGDLEFFREQYVKASGFVSSVRRENEELESRARIAEEQTTTGVAMVKATFEKRIEKLEDDAKNWKRIAIFMMEKDQRTNDEIRRRAGEEPELRARYNDLEEQYDIVTEQVASLEDELEQKSGTIQQLEDEIDQRKAEITRLSLQYHEAQTRHERSNKDEGFQNDHELIYRCEWRPDGGNDPCEGLFVSVEELQQHLLDGHLRT